MLLINVIYTMKPGQREAFLKEVQAQGILEAVRREDGCMQYTYYLPVEEDDTCCWWSAGGTRLPSRPIWPPTYGRSGQIKEQCVVRTQIISGTAAE